MNWFGLGKKRSKLGRWIDSHGISQGELQKRAKLSKATISRLCSDKDHQPNMKTIKRIVETLKKLDPNVKADDFFDM